MTDLCTKTTSNTVVHKAQISYASFRPVTADSRFRFWKTWLVEKIEAEERQPREAKEVQALRRSRNDAAFQVIYHYGTHIAVYQPFLFLAYKIIEKHNDRNNLGQP